jgi:hypothetical protein
MHHMRLRCGWRAFFFKGLAHGLVGERVDIGQLDHVLGQKPQGPAGLSVRRSWAGQRDQVSFLGAVEFTFIDALATPIGAQRWGKTLFDKALAHALYGRDPGLERLSNARVWPGRPTVGLIGLEQDLGVLDLANVSFAPRQQPLELFAFGKGEGHAVLLVHGRPPVSTGPHNKNLQPTPSALTED